MSFESLKAKGNEYFINGEYENAIDCYSEALTFQPQNHLLFSNRSVAYFKLNMYQKGYDDAVQCVTIAPEFARGYLRKATALNGLKRYVEAIPVAEEGYKLRGSDRICKDCVTQWLQASTALVKNDVAKLDDIPPGVSPITEKCFEIFYEIQEQNSSKSGVSIGNLEVHMHRIVEELECILKRFGHSLSPHMCEWMTALMQSLKLDPRTHAPPPASVELLNEKAKDLVLWLDSEVDHILYPVIQPVIGLLTLTMLTCVSTLNQMISFRSRIEILTKACLVFYKESILSTKLYLRLHIHALQNLLNSFCMETGHNRRRDEKEATEIKSLIEESRSLLGQYDRSYTDYAEVKKSTELVMENAAVLLSSDSTQDQPFKRITKQDGEMLCNQATTEVKTLASKIDSLNFRHMDSLVLATGGLVYTGEIECAKMVLKQTQSFYLAVITKLLENKLLSLSDAAECFFHPQAMMFCNALFLAGIDDKLLANTIIAWKCLSTELYALLARIGLSSSLRGVFNKLESLKADGKGKGNEEKMLVELANQHQKEVDDIVQKWGKKAVSVLLNQCWEEVQKALAHDQMLLQYCMCPLYDTQCYPVPIPPKVLKMTGVVIAIRSDGFPLIVKTLNFGSIQQLALESHDRAMKAVAAKRAGKPWQDLQSKADKTAYDLLQVMLPDDLQLLLSDVSIKRVYFCPDQILAKFPVEILPFKDGERLGNKVAITYLSSARELLRESTLPLICSDNVTQVQPGPLKKCAIFANPNFDLEKTDIQSGRQWSLLKTVLSTFFSEASKELVHIVKAYSLPESESEARDIEHLLSSVHIGSELCEVDVAIGDDATLYKALQMRSPLILHFATHGFSNPDFHYQYHNFWSDIKSGLILAGFNTYRLQKYDAIADGAGTGELTALAACGMSLVGTRLVYLSMCRSSYGFIGRGEALSSLAQGFRIAGSQTIIATLWPVSDEVGRKMALNFYSFVAKGGMHPSLALQAAKKKLNEEGYEHWYDWAGFLCIGIDAPVFI